MKEEVLSDHIKDCDMGGTCSTHWRNEKCI